MDLEVPADLAEKAAIMREFGRRRAAGEPVSAELYAAARKRNQRSLRNRARAWPTHPRFRPSGSARCFEIAPGSQRAQRLAAGVSSQRGLVTILPLPTGRVGTIAFDAGEKWRPDRGRQL